MEGQFGTPHPPTPPRPQPPAPPGGPPPPLGGPLRRSRRGTLGVVLGGTALLLAVVALSTALIALGRANSAQRVAASSSTTDGQPGPSSLPASQEASAGSDGSPSESGGSATSTAPPTGRVQPTPVYRVHYQEQHLRIPP